MRSNWRTLGKTWDEIASWKSSLTDKYTFDFLKGKAVLEATVSDGYSSNYLQRNKKKYGFAKVVGCSDFFDFSLRERDNFDAVVSNPPWDEHFLKLFYQFLKLLGKPFVLILPRRAVRHKNFVDVFGKSSHMTVID